MNNPYAPKKKARFIRPPNLFKQKVGMGGINPALIEKAQEHIATNDMDLKPYAVDYLKSYKKAIEAAHAEPKNFAALKEDVVRPIMQLKANGGMFGYALVSIVADIALRFIEAIETINEDAYTVLQAHYKTLNVIISNELKGSGGKEGQALADELDHACQRFFEKYKENE